MELNEFSHYHTMRKILIALLFATTLVVPPAVFAEGTLSGSFVDADWIHKTQGTATITVEDETSILSLEDFKTTNGPDLYVYLSTDEKASVFVNLGRLQSSNGDQTYEIPEGVDLSKYDKVLIWCKAFGVLFGTAELS